MLTLDTFSLFPNLLPEAICYCIKTCYVCGVLVTLPYTYIPTFMATTANVRVVIGTLGLFISLAPEAICCCLQTCYVYGVLLTCLAYTYQVSWPLVLTLGSYR